MITDGVYAYLSTHATITALVGTRIYGGLLAQNVVYPCIVFKVISDPPVEVLAGKAPLYRALIQFDIYAEEYEEARGIAAALCGVFEQYSQDTAEGKAGLMGTTTVRKVTAIEPGVDGFDNTSQDFRVIAEYEFWHTV